MLLYLWVAYYLCEAALNRQRVRMGRRLTVRPEGTIGTGAGTVMP